MVFIAVGGRLFSLVFTTWNVVHIAFQYINILDNQKKSKKIMCRFQNWYCLLQKPREKRQKITYMKNQKSIRIMAGTRSKSALINYPFAVCCLPLYVFFFLGCPPNKRTKLKTQDNIATVAKDHLWSSPSFNPLNKKSWPLPFN